MSIFSDIIIPKSANKRAVLEETGMTVSADERLKIRTDRDFARLDITYAGKYLHGEFKPSDEVTEAKFYDFENLPLLPKDQLIYIERAVQKNLGDNIN